MCKRLTSEAFREYLHEHAKDKDIKKLIEYLKCFGLIQKENNGIVNMSDECCDRLSFMLDDIKLGDAVFISSEGICLVIDLRPAVNPDGHHCRVIPLTINTEGEYVIKADKRSIVVSSADIYRIKETKFDIKKIERLSWERYQAYCKIEEINRELSLAKEE